MGTAFENLKKRQIATSSDPMKEVSAFEALKQRQGVISTPQKEVEGKTGMEGVATGFAKGIGSTIKNLGQLGEATGRVLLPKALEPKGNVYSEEALTKSKEKGGISGRLLSEDVLKAKSPSEKVGKVLEFGAELFLPVGAASKTKALTPTLKGFTNKLLPDAAIVAEKTTQRENKIIGEILQGGKDDVARGKRILSSLDSTKIKTYDEGYKALEQRTKDLAKAQDDLLETSTDIRKLDKLTTKVKAGETTFDYNYVDDALNQLEDFYTKTNNQAGKFEIQLLKKKATEEGLTAKQVNDIARIHGQKLNAFNVNGELASGLTKQAAENTRAGVKSTAREIFGGEASKAIDKDITDTIRVKDLFEKMSVEVNKLQQKIQERSLGAKLGNIVGRGVNLLSLGSAKGLVEALVPRGQGFKTLNALDLERALQKNLKTLQELSSKNVSKEEMIKGLQSVFSKDLKPAQSSMQKSINQPIPPKVPQLKIPSKKLSPKPPKLK